MSESPVHESGHRFIDHTADIAIEAWAPSETSLLVEAARAVIDVITEGSSPQGTDERRLTLESIDAEDRVVRWLNEVLWLAIGQGFLVCDADITLHDDGLEATVRGLAGGAEAIKTEVKAATYHDLRLARDPSGRYLARIVLDV